MPETLNVIELQDNANYQARLEQQKKLDAARSGVRHTEWQLGDIEYVLSVINGMSIHAGTLAAKPENTHIKSYMQGREDAYREAFNWLLPYVLDARSQAKKTLEALER
jgi:hypothetical protein